MDPQTRWGKDRLRSYFGGRIATDVSHPLYSYTQILHNPRARLDVAAWVVWCNIFIIRNKDKYLKLNIEHETLAVRLAACASLTIKPKGP